MYKYTYVLMIMRFSLVHEYIGTLAHFILLFCDPKCRSSPDFATSSTIKKGRFYLSALPQKVKSMESVESKRLTRKQEGLTYLK